MKSWFDFLNSFVPGMLPFVAWSAGEFLIPDLQVAQNLGFLLEQGYNYIKYPKHAADFVPLPKVSEDLCWQ